MKGKSVGWLILVAALAVPAVFFQNFMKKMKSSAAPMEIKRKPDGGPSLSGGVRSQPDGGLPNPIRSSSPTAAGQAPGQEPGSVPAGGHAPADPPASGSPGDPAAAPPGGSVGASPSGPGPGASPAPGGSASATPPAGSSPSPGTAGSGAVPVDPGQPSAASPTAAPGGRDHIEYAPQSDRDPTLSVIDEQKLAIERETARAAEEEMRAKVEDAKKKKQSKLVKKPAEVTIVVQGIIAMEGGNKAIVNDETHGVGDKISACSITRITSKQVFFRCGGGKSFFKTVQ